MSRRWLVDARKAKAKDDIPRPVPNECGHRERVARPAMSCNVVFSRKESAACAIARSWYQMKVWNRVPNVVLWEDLR